MAFACIVHDIFFGRRDPGSDRGPGWQRGGAGRARAARGFRTALSPHTGHGHTPGAEASLPIAIHPIRGRAFNTRLGPLMVQIPGLSSLPCLAHRGVAYRVPRPRSRAPPPTWHDAAALPGHKQALPRRSSAVGISHGSLAPLYQMMMTMLQTRFQPMA